MCNLINTHIHIMYLVLLIGSQGRSHELSQKLVRFLIETSGSDKFPKPAVFTSNVH